MALTAGLLLFLAFDSIEEAVEVSDESLAGSFNGALLVATVVVLSFLGLYYTREKLVQRSSSSKFAKPVAIALMISIGIGLHNFGEGLAIGAAVGMGSIAFSTFLIVGFVYSPFTSVIFLSIGAGTIFQVIIVLIQWLREEGDKNLSSASVASGFAVGMLVMYLTSIFV